MEVNNMSGQPSWKIAPFESLIGSCSKLGLGADTPSSIMGSPNGVQVLFDSFPKEIQF